jgi:hypothetical protein
VHDHKNLLPNGASGAIFIARPSDRRSPFTAFPTDLAVLMTRFFRCPDNGGLSRVARRFSEHIRASIVSAM